MEKFKERLDALSDAILAIAMTILVLEIKPPHTMGGISVFLTSIGLFIISFFVIFNFWYERTQNNVLSETTNDEIIALDVVTHLTICLIPLATKFMIEFEHKNIAVVVYGTLTLIIGLLSDLVRHRMVKHRIIEVSQEIREKILLNMIRFGRRSFFARLVFLIIAFYNPTWGVYAYLIIPLFMFWRRYEFGKFYIENGETVPSAIDIFEQMSQGNFNLPQKK